MSSTKHKKIKFDNKGSFVWTFDSKVQTISFYIEKKSEYLGENGKWEQSKVFFDIVPIFRGRDIVGEIRIDINSSIIDIIVCSKQTDSFKFVLLADNNEIGCCTLSTRKFNKPTSCSPFYTKQEGGKVLSEHVETITFGDLSSDNTTNTFRKINLKKPERHKDKQIIKPQIGIIDEGNSDVLTMNQNDSDVVSFDALFNKKEKGTENNIVSSNESTTSFQTNNTEENLSSSDSIDIDIRFSNRSKNEELLIVSKVPLMIYWVGIPLGIIFILYIVYMILNYIGQ